MEIIYLFILFLFTYLLIYFFILYYSFIYLFYLFIFIYLFLFIYFYFIYFYLFILFIYSIYLFYSFHNVFLLDHPCKQTDKQTRPKRRIKPFESEFARSMNSVHNRVWKSVGVPARFPDSLPESFDPIPSHAVPFTWTDSRNWSFWRWCRRLWRRRTTRPILPPNPPTDPPDSAHSRLFCAKCAMSDTQDIPT
jgi:hypothetical protein